MAWGFDRNLAGAEVFSGFISFTLWGFYTCLLITTLWIAHFRGSVRRCWPPIAVIVVVYLLNLYDLCVMLYVQHRGFALYQGGPNAYFALSSIRVLDTVLQAIQDYLLGIATLLVDLVMCWRVYIIYGRSLAVLIIPTALLIADIILASVDVAQTLQSPTHWTSPAYRDEVQATSAAFFGVAMVLNWYFTAMICYKVAWVEKAYRQGFAVEDQRYRRGMYMKIILTFVESGALYSIVIGGYALACATGCSRAGAIIYAMLIRVIGIVPTLIVLQLNLGYARPADIGSDTVVAGNDTSRPRFRTFRSRWYETGESTANNTVDLGGQAGAGIPIQELTHFGITVIHDVPTDCLSITRAVQSKGDSETGLTV